MSFVMNSSRIVTLERHQMTSDWDIRFYLVIRDFWKYVEDRKPRRSKKRELKKEIKSDTKRRKRRK